MSATDDLLPIPPQPEISEGNEVFHQKAYNLYKWMREKLAPAIMEVVNLIRNAVTGAFSATSSSSMEISEGVKSINISTGRSFSPGTPFRIARTSDPVDHYVDGITISYDSGTGAFVGEALEAVGSGTYTDWTISIIPSGSGLAGLANNKFTGQQVFANEVTVASASTLDLTALNTNQVKITGTTALTGVTMPQSAVIIGRPSGALPLTNSSSFIVQGGADYTCTPGDILTFLKDGDSNVRVMIDPISGKSIVDKRPSVRQTVLSGPVDGNGFPSFGGSTGGTSITVSGALRITSANGEVDNVLDITNPSWTGLNVNGTMYLWIDTVTGATGASTLAPNYQFGGAYSTTSGQHTYNTQEAVMKVGDGSATNQVNRVFVGECLVASNVVSTITWYALKGKYRSALTAIPSASARTVFNTNIGVSPQIVRAFARCKSATGGYAVGEYAQASTFRDDGSYGYAYNPVVPESRNVVSFITGNNSSLAVVVQSKSSPGSNIQATSANWDLLLEAERGF